jgi:hypothetical protein
VLHNDCIQPLLHSALICLSACALQPHHELFHAVQEEDVWMRLELHDAALATGPAEDDAAAVGDRQRSGLTGGLRKALGSLSSATMKVGAAEVPDPGAMHGGRAAW